MAESEFVKMQLQCPLPKLDYDIITLGHGSGGILTHRLLDDVIFKALGDRVLPQSHDGAIFQIKGKMAMTTDSFVVSPLTFPGGNIGDLAVNGTINDLAMCGARPRYISLAFIIEEGFSIKEFWEILISIRYAAQVSNVFIATGDTKVVDKGSGDQLFINTTGVGEIQYDHSFDGSRCALGDQIIVSGPIASHGMAIMSVRDGLEFESKIESDTQSVYSNIEHLLSAFGDQIKFLRDPTRGGIGTVLTELAQTQKLGIDLSQNSLPVLPQVHAACELLGLDPIYVANEGVFLTIVSADIADHVIAELHKVNGDEHAAIIGTVVADHPEKVVMQSAIGGRRVVSMLIGQQLPRIC